MKAMEYQFCGQHSGCGAPILPPIFLFVCVLITEKKPHLLSLLPSKKANTLTSNIQSVRRDSDVSPINFIGIHTGQIPIFDIRISVPSITIGISSGSALVRFKPFYNRCK